MTVTQAAPEAGVRSRVDVRRRHPRTIGAIGCLAAAILVFGIVALCVGSVLVPIDRVVAALFGQGTRADGFIVLTLRLPRFLLALLVGVAFGLAGAILQSVLRNPLASPDIIGVTGGASAAAVTALLLFGLGSTGVALAAFGGAAIVATAAILLGGVFRRGGVAGYRFVLVGIAIAFLVQAVLGWLLTRADVREAEAAYVWLVGSVASANWPEIAVTAVGLVVLVPLSALAAPRLRMLELGDDTATALGVPVPRSRVALIAISVAFAALGTAAAGPLAFVAFAAAPIARRMLGGRGSLVASALVGAVIVLAADLVARQLLPGTIQVPTGIVTGIFGGGYLLWLLASSRRSERSSA